jgi:hypothetical protein
MKRVSRNFWLRLFFVQAICVLAGFAFRVDAAPTAVTNPPANFASEKYGDTIELLDGSTLHGELREIDANTGLIWKNTEAKEPIQFKPDNLAWVRFPHSEKIIGSNSQASCQFRFVNGDEFFGNLLSLNENELELQTWFGGKFKTPRAMVRSIRFFAKGEGTIYEGPTSLEGWRVGKNPIAQPWEYRDGAFIGNSPNSIGRDLHLPDASRVEFDLSWVAPFNLLFSFYTGVFDGFNYNSGSYIFYISPGNISLQRMAASGGSATLGRTEAILSMVTKKNVHLEFRANKEENLIEILADEKLINQWKDSAGWAGKGTGILFYTQTDGAAVKISNIKVSEWDGKPSFESVTDSGGADDQLYLANRDKVSGKVTSLHDGKLGLASTSNSLEIPLQRITQIFFGNTNTNVVARNPWEIQASVSGGGTISFALEKWNNEKVFGQNKNFGKISLNSQSIRHIEFNPGKPKPGETDSLEDTLWEVNEK